MFIPATRTGSLWARASSRARASRGLPKKPAILGITRADTDGHHRRHASSSADSPGPGTYRPGSSNALLAFSVGSLLSGALGYYFATSDATTNGTGITEFNTQYGSPEDFEKAIGELKRALADEDGVSTDEEDLERHGASAFVANHPGSYSSLVVLDYGTDVVRAVGSSPSVVVYPTSTEDVVKIVKIAVKYRVPVVPYSGASSLEGHYLAVSRVKPLFLSNVQVHNVGLTHVSCFAAVRRRHMCRYVADGQNLGNTWSVGGR